MNDETPPGAPDGWVAGERMPGPAAGKPKWYEDTQGPCPANQAATFNVIAKGVSEPATKAGGSGVGL